MTNISRFQPVSISFMFYTLFVISACCPCYSLLQVYEGYYHIMVTLLMSKLSSNQCIQFKNLLLGIYLHEILNPGLGL